MARILLAEDEINLYRLVSFRLKQQGHEVVWAEDGSRALTMAAEILPDLILLDIIMPVFDGFHVLKQLKANIATQSIPVIILTARNYDKDVVTAIESGADDYVVKPFSFPELIVRINAALARRAREYRC